MSRRIAICFLGAEPEVHLPIPPLSKLIQSREKLNRASLSQH